MVLWNPGIVKSMYKIRSVSYFAEQIQYRTYFQRPQADCTCRDQLMLSLVLEKVCPSQTHSVYTGERSFVHR